MARTPVAADDFNRTNNPVETGNSNWTQIDAGWGHIDIDTNAIGIFYRRERRQ